MNQLNFDEAFATLTGNPPFPWQQNLYREWFAKGKFPSSCNLPTGLGKTSVVAIWLIALANHPDLMPRRLVYVVNRRTVVDQTTNEVEKLRANLPKLNSSLGSLGLSTLRGQFADNREWSGDPSRPAVICGTVDMIGSRLLFGGYGVGFKGKPLHAGFLGQDVLLIHDEAHLEPAFQKLLLAVECEQKGGRLNEHCECIDQGKRPGDFRPLRAMELTATSRAAEASFELTTEEKSPPDKLPEITEQPPPPLHVVWQRIKAKKALTLIPAVDDKQALAKIIAQAEGYKDSGQAVLIFVRTVEAVNELRKALTEKGKGQTPNVSVLTGTLRGLERDKMTDPRREGADPVFARFLKPPKQTKIGETIDEKEAWKVLPQAGSVFLICTSAGEVGIDISADHLISDLMPFDSMAQRFGRVNRYGTGEATLHVVYPERLPSESDVAAERKKEKPKLEVIFDGMRRRCLKVLRSLSGDASPLALGKLALADRLAAFSPQPIILPVSEILFDSWALTTIKGKLPGRPPVEPYLHGISEYDPPQTTVAWRQEVETLTPEILEHNKLEIEDLLEMYPLKPQEELKAPTYGKNKVFEQLEDIAARDAKREPNKRLSGWVIDPDGSVAMYSLEKLVEKDKQKKPLVSLGGRTVILPPHAGGLSGGLLKGDEAFAGIIDDYDVSGKWYADAARTIPRRGRVWNDDKQFAEKIEGMRLIQRIDLPAPEDDEDAGGRSWHWFTRPNSADDDGSKTAKAPITWQHHTTDVEYGVQELVDVLLKDHTDLHDALVLAARFHDLGKKRVLWQRSIGNPIPKDWHAKSGKDPKTGLVWKPLELTDYRHEFGSLVDVEGEPEFKKLSNAMKDLVLHIIAVHHGYGRPHFPADKAFDPEGNEQTAANIAVAVPQRFARLQRKYGHWGLAYLESLLRAADYAASAQPSKLPEVEE